MSKISVVGIGPGGLSEMTPKARQAIESAQVVAGYNTYIKLIEKIIGGKKIIGRAMMQEVERCQLAIEETLAGRDVAVVSSGDAGVYGMAGVVFLKVFCRQSRLPLEDGRIPGVPSRMSGTSAREAEWKESIPGHALHGLFS